MDALGQALHARLTGSLQKRAISVVDLYKGKASDDISPYDNRVPALSYNKALAIARAMEAASEHDALKNTRVTLGGAQYSDMVKRVRQNPRNWWWTKKTFQRPEEFPDRLRDSGDYFMPLMDDVALPSRSPGILVHELGHAVDMNGYPADSRVRALGGAVYERFAPMLWTEHAAWRKGEDRFLRGSARHKLDPKLVQQTLQSIRQTKPAGLGSYWGASLGGFGGAFAGAYGSRLINPTMPRGGQILTSILGSLIGSGLGAGAGFTLGRLWGSRDSLADEKAQEQYLRQYAHTYAQEHNVTPDAALLALQKRLKRKPRK